MREMTLAMLREDWWWPWWVSSLIDLGIVVIAAAVLFASSRRAVKLLAGVFVLAGLVAAVMAPIVMTEDSNRMEPAKTPSMSR
jgi:K+ transporter